MALSFGLLSLAIAFVAEYFGGLSQASMTIFGVVGGPLLALFTLGMFSTAVEQKVVSIYYTIMHLNVKCCNLNRGPFVVYCLDYASAFGSDLVVLNQNRLVFRKILQDVCRSTKPSTEKTF